MWPTCFYSFIHPFLRHYSQSILPLSHSFTLAHTQSSLFLINHLCPIYFPSDGSSGTFDKPSPWKQPSNRLAPHGQWEREVSRILLQWWWRAWWAQGECSGRREHLHSGIFSSKHGWISLSLNLFLFTSCAYEKSGCKNVIYNFSFRWQCWI